MIVQGSSFLDEHPSDHSDFEQKDNIANLNDDASEQEIKSNDDSDVDYFTFNYKNGTIDFNDSMNFDSRRFIEDVKNLLRRIKVPAEAHKVKLFFCQAFKIPMDDLTVSQSNEKFADTMLDHVSRLDTATMNSDVGYGGFLKESSDPDEFEVDADEPNS